jgi:hypothetical protein
VVVGVEGKRHFARAPFRHPNPVNVIICLRLESVDLILGERCHRNTFDPVAKLAVDAAAIRAHKDAVGNIHIHSTLFTAVGTFFVACIAHKSTEDLLVLLLDGHNRF